MYRQVIACAIFVSFLMAMPNLGYRYRHLIKVSIPLPSIHPAVSLVLADEFFVNLTHPDTTSIRRGFDHNRAIAGLAYKIATGTVMEIGYMNQYLSRKETPRPDQMQHILLTSLLLQF